MCGCLSWAPYWRCTLTGNQTRDPLLRNPALNALSHTSQGSIHSSIVLFGVLSDCCKFCSSVLHKNQLYCGDGPYKFKRSENWNHVLKCTMHLSKSIGIKTSHVPLVSRWNQSYKEAIPPTAPNSSGESPKG